MMLNVTVNGGIADLWSLAESADERKAIKVAAESPLEFARSTIIWSPGPLADESELTAAQTGRCFKTAA
ncbi:hypothetical protein ACH79_26385 [Bradyrhizobium sp. CCBAU 051011]|nr:hypothetical protein ACH79_26385 [Bradyrhizobium sp. CCBAU 051011]